LAQDSLTDTPTNGAAPPVSPGKQDVDVGILLNMENISKSFPGVKALSNVSFEVSAGEIRGLIGENGAGKSTLMKILSGVYEKDSGELHLNGEPVEIERKCVHRPRAEPFAIRSLARSESPDPGPAGFARR
jgi:ABC-type branched-subunit amino acid transport system ATPase component